MNPDEAVKSLVERLFLGLVQHNQHLEVVMTGEDLVRTIHVRANREDTPRAIGQKGAHFRAIQYIVQKAGDTIGKSIHLSPIRPGIHGEEGRRMPKFKPNPAWPKVEIAELIRESAQYVVGRPIAGEPVTVEIKHNPGEYRADVMIKVPPHIDDSEIVEMAGHFTSLFQSIGKTNGVILTFDIVCR